MTEQPFDTESTTKKDKVYIRPTLIIGLGGTGARVATELKARLEEQLGSKSNYGQVIKLVCFDTANENFQASQPNTPGAMVELIAGREFIRISDVPLYGLSNSGNANLAIANILPETLHSTQIDQGAQQVRRLGRVALFYRYSLVKDALSRALRDLRSRDRKNPLGSTPDLKEIHVPSSERTRVYIITSICGGTGSGTFIDIAYLVRHFAKSLGEVDVHGMLLLPEAFPEIATTGQQRIRANAYAALLDLEYYNQATSDGRPLYQVEFPADPVSIPGRPFTNCYLINDGTIGGTANYAPLLAEILQVMITSRVGEQLDATLDNIRGYLNVYYKGYRAFYSAIGLGQILMPRAWQRQIFITELQKIWIEKIITVDRGTEWGAGNSPTEHASSSFDGLTQIIRSVLESNLSSKLAESLVPLTTLNLDTPPTERLAADLQRAFFEVEEKFRSNILREIESRAKTAFNNARLSLNEAIKNNINDGLNTKQQNRENTLRGLHWTRHWLESLEKRINDVVREKIAGLSFSQRASQILTRQLSPLKSRTVIPLIGAYQTRRQARQARTHLTEFFDNEIRPESRLITDQLIMCYSELLPIIAEARKDILNALTGWKDHLKRRNPPKAPKLAPLMQSAINVEAELNALQKKAKLKVFVEGRDTEINPQELEILGNARNIVNADIQHGIGELYDSTQANLQRRVFDSFDSYCMDSYARLTQQEDNKLLTVDKAILRDMGSQAKPLTAYDEDEIGVTPREIKIFGARLRSEAETLMMDIGQPESDQSSIETGDADRLQYLVTHHGYPITYLKGFKDYQRNYESLSTKPDDPNSRYAIFHLDNERENAPYDPGSLFFVNLEDIEMRFARALAYGWIVRSDVPLYDQNEPKSSGDVHLFVYPKDTFTRTGQHIDENEPVSFFGFLQRFAHQKIRELDNLKTSQQEKINTMEQEDILLPKEKRLLQLYENQLNALTHYFPVKSDINEIKFTGLIREMRKAAQNTRWVMEADNTTYYMILAKQNKKPFTLDVALDAIHADKERLLQRLFIQAFDTAYKHARYLEKTFHYPERDTLNGKLEKFLKDRGLLEGTINPTWFTELGQTGRQIEQRMCQLLLVHYRVENRLINSERNFHHQEIRDVDAIANRTKGVL